MLLSPKLGLSAPQVALISHEIAQWKEQTKYVPTIEDEAVLRAVAFGTIRRTIYKVGAATAATAAAGMLINSRIKTMPKIPLPVSVAVGFIIGTYLDTATRQRELLGSWVQLQRRTATPLSEKIYKTVAEVAPASSAGEIAQSWLDEHAALLPIQIPKTQQLPIPSHSPVPHANRPLPRRAGSGYYDVTASNNSNDSNNSNNSGPAHRPGSGFYDITKNGGLPHIPSSSHTPSPSLSPSPPINPPQPASPSSPSSAPVAGSEMIKSQEEQEGQGGNPISRHRPSNRYLRRPRNHQEQVEVTTGAPVEATQQLTTRAQSNKNPGSTNIYGDVI